MVLNDLLTLPEGESAPAIAAAPTGDLAALWADADAARANLRERLLALHEVTEGLAKELTRRLEGGQGHVFDLPAGPAVLFVEGDDTLSLRLVPLAPPQP